METRRIALLVIVLLLVTAQAVPAASFAEKFRQFVLGSDAEAYATHSEALRADPETAACLGCHDGTMARDVAIKGADAPYQVSGFRTVNHPVGMSYDDYAQRKPREYRPKHLLDRSIRLREGKVTCLSCHRLRSQAPTRMAQARRACMASDELTTGPRRGDLCLACHLK
jgi:hypothetical protein